MSKPTAPVKVAIDCSSTGRLEAEQAAALAGSFREAALAAITEGDLEKAAAAMQNAKDVLAAPVKADHPVVELDADELAALEQHRAEQADLAAATVAARHADIVARCDRYLALTDWIMAPASARPVDMSDSLAKACDKHAKAWAGWRAKVKEIRAAAVAGTADPDDPGFPDQPAAPALALT